MKGGGSEVFPVGQQVALGGGAPQAVVGLDDVGQGVKALVLFALFAQVGQGRQGQVDVGVDQLLAAGDLGQVEGGLARGVQPADVGDHDGRVQPALGGHPEGFQHIGGVAAGGAHDVGGVVVDVVEVHLGAELFVGRPGEEVQAAVPAQDGRGLGDHRRHRRVAQHVVIALAAADGQQFGHRVGQFAGIDKVQLDALGGPLLRREEAGRAVEAVLVDVGDHHHRGVDVAVERVGQRAQAHRAGAGHDGQAAVLLDAHLVGVDAHLGVVGGVEGADRAAHRVGQGGFVVGLAGVFQHAAALHHLGGQDAVGGVAAAELVGVAGAPHGALVVEGGLDGELHAGLILVLVFRAHLDDIAGELVAHDGGVLGHVGVDPLVAGAEDGALVGGHADGVGHHLDQDLVLLDGGQLKGIDPQVVGGVQTQGFRFHNRSPFLLQFLQFVPDDLGHQRCDDTVFGGLGAAAHDVGRAGGGREDHRRLEGQALLFGQGQGRDDAVSRADGAAHRHPQPLGQEGALARDIEAALAAQRDHHLVDPRLQQIAGGGVQLLDASQLPAHQPGQLVVVGLDEVGRGPEPFGQEVPVGVEKDLGPRRLAGGCPGAVGVPRRAGRQAARQHHNVPDAEGCRQLCQQGVQLGGGDGGAGLVDVGVGVVCRVDDLQVAAGLAGFGVAEIAVEAEGAELRGQGAAGLAGQKAGGPAGPAQLGDDLGDVDPLAAGVGAQRGDAVDGVEGEMGYLHRFIQRRVEGDGIDHGVTSLVDSVAIRRAKAKRKPRIRSGCSGFIVTARRAKCKRRMGRLWHERPVPKQKQRPENPDAAKRCLFVLF